MFTKHYLDYRGIDEQNFQRINYRIFFFLKTGLQLWHKGGGEGMAGEGAGGVSLKAIPSQQQHHSTSPG